MKLTPTIIQDAKTRNVYMLGYMNDGAFALTKQTGYVHFWSRKRKKIRKKGETSGNVLKIVTIQEDCDKDTLLIQVNLIGSCVCHTGNITCFKKINL